MRLGPGPGGLELVLGLVIFNFKILFRQSTLQNVENLDMKEINFNTSKKDLAEAKIHHMLTEVMAKPQLRQRKYRYYTSSND